MPAGSIVCYINPNPEVYRCRSQIRCITQIQPTPLCSIFNVYGGSVPMHKTLIIRGYPGAVDNVVIPSNVLLRPSFRQSLKIQLKLFSGDATTKVYESTRAPMPGKSDSISMKASRLRCLGRVPIPPKYSSWGSRRTAGIAGQVCQTCRVGGPTRVEFASANQTKFARLE